KASAGWTRAFWNTGNTSVFLNGAAAKSRAYYRFFDNSNLADGGTEARLRGYETMTGYSTGSNAFPTTGQEANGLQIAKRISTDTESVPFEWIIAADHGTCLLFTMNGPRWFGSYFGDFVSYKPGDLHGAIVIGGKQALTLLNDANQRMCDRAYIVDAIGGTDPSSPFTVGHYLRRDTTATLVPYGSRECWKITTSQIVAPNVTVATRAPGCVGWGWLGASNPAGGGLVMGRFGIVESNEGIRLRGHLRGMWALAHRTDAFADGSTVDGTGTLAGRTFLVLHMRAPGMIDTDPGVLLAVETSDTVEA
ncbi:MAG: hypothetical protein Q8N51_09440, partial [Gammaproteobacteria bacterium]|nr:hypothetical protein [Gammaproteobacteria bacterium]